MANEYSEPGKLVLTIFDRLIDRIKSSRPVRTDGKSLTTGFVYSQLVLGMPIDPTDYMNPWSPAGGGTVQESLKTQPALAAPTNGQPANPAGAVAPGIDPKIQKAINAAWKTSRLVDTMIMVTNDDSYQEYPTTRHISFSYEGIINGMQPLPMPPIPPDVQKQIDDSQKVLYELDPADGSITGKSKLYKAYLKNSEAYAQAKTDYTMAQAKALGNPATAPSWPLLSAGYQQKVDDAYDAWKTEGAEKVERALDILESVGISMQAHMIAKARQIFDLWNLAGLSGVPDKTPYSYISPSGWADPDNDDEGWTHLSVTQNDYQTYSEWHHATDVMTNYSSHFSSTQGGGGFSIFGFGAHGGGGASNSSWSSHYQSSDGTQYEFLNEAKNLSIDLEYALCTINRPWLVGDLFYLGNWYEVGNTKDAISDGTVGNQVKKFDKIKGTPLLPMIPVQFLVVRNVKIKATQSDWGGDGATLRQMQSDASAQGSSWNAGGGAGFSLGFFSIGGEASHTEGSSSSQFHNSEEDNAYSDYGWHFDGETLEIKGAQLIAFLSEVVPETAPLDDPNLPH